MVPLIEEGWLESEVTDKVLMQYLQPLLDDGVDTLVLGCTHYPLLRPAISRLLGDAITLVDSAENCATALRQLLESEGLMSGGNEAGRLQIALTDSPDSFLEIANEALQLEVGEIALRQL